MQFKNFSNKWKCSIQHKVTRNIIVYKCIKIMNSYVSLEDPWRSFNESSVGVNRDRTKGAKYNGVNNTRLIISTWSVELLVCVYGMEKLQTGGGRQRRVKWTGTKRCLLTTIVFKSVVNIRIIAVRRCKYDVWDPACSANRITHTLIVSFSQKFIQWTGCIYECVWIS